MAKDIVILAAFCFPLLAFASTQPEIRPQEPLECPVVEVNDVQVPLTTHAQETWISALEWCESSGDPTRINPNDSDGTPSYYSFQFKPATFRSLGIKYGLVEPGLSSETLMELMKDTDLQRDIVRRMILDSDIRITSQFPGCIRKIGLPPV